MSKVAPVGPIYQAGTLSGNPLAVASGLAMLRFLKAHPEVYTTIEQRTAALCAESFSVVTINRVGLMFTFFFKYAPAIDSETAKTADTAIFAKFFHDILKNGVVHA